jgi:RNA-directed DNA polymerase
VRFPGATHPVMGFQYRDDAERFQQELRKRLGKFGLEIHDEKTRLIEFGRYAEANRVKRGEGKPETFDFLGFTHICGRTPKKKRYTVLRKTVAKRLRAKIKEVKGQLLERRHEPVPEHGKWLRSVVQGHLNYFAVPGNRYRTDVFRTQVIRAWLYALRRRSHKARKLNWKRFWRLVKTWIPTSKTMHPYPYERLCVSHPR